jgi:hypothetical protein
MYHWQSEHGSGTCVMMLRAVRQVLSNTYHDWWTGRGGFIAWPPRSPHLNPLDFSCGDTWNLLWMQILLIMKRHFSIALWLPVRLSATIPASMNGCGGPWWNVWRCALNLMEGILGSYYNCTFSHNSQTKRFLTYVDMGCFSCFVLFWYSELVLEFCPHI